MTMNDAKGKRVDVLAVMDGARECLREGPIGVVAIGINLEKARAAVAELIEALKEIYETASSPIGSPEGLLDSIERRSIAALKRIGGEK